MADDTVFINNEGGAAADESLLVKDAIGFDHLSLDVAEQWKSHTYVLLEAIVSRVAINTNADDLRVALFKVGDISLIRL